MNDGLDTLCRVSLFFDLIVFARQEGCARHLIVLAGFDKGHALSTSARFADLVNAQAN